MTFEPEIQQLKEADDAWVKKEWMRCEYKLEQLISDLESTLRFVRKKAKEERANDLRRMPGSRYNPKYMKSKKRKVRK
jgi:hypothetical protein